MSDTALVNMTSPDLSPHLAGSIDWSAIRKQAVGFKTLGAGTGGPEAAPKATEEQVRRVFNAAKLQFSKSLTDSKRLTSYMLYGLGIPVIVVAVGVLIAAVYNSVIGGVGLTLVGVGGLIGLVRELLKIGRDQAFLSFFLSGYELAFALAKTEEQYGQVLSRFLEDISQKEQQGLKTKAPSNKGVKP